MMTQAHAPANEPVPAEVVAKVDGRAGMGEEAPRSSSAGALELNGQSARDRRLPNFAAAGARQWAATVFAALTDRI